MKQRTVLSWDVQTRPSREADNVQSDTTWPRNPPATFQALITRLSTLFINLNAREIDAAIVEAIEAIGRFASVDRAYLFFFAADGATMKNTHEWCAEGIEPQIEHLQALPVDVFPWWTAHIKRHEVIHIARVIDMPDEAAAERQILMDQDVASIVVVPMTSEGQALGFLGFDSVRAEKSWAEEDVALLRIAGEIFVNALHRKRSEEARQQLEAQLIQMRSLDNVAKLAGGIAHDFNNLLSVILNYATILRKQIQDPTLLQYIDELLASASQAAHLTRQLLIVGRRGIVDLVVLHLNDSVLELENLLRRTLGENIELVLELGEDVQPVKAGVPQIEQVIINLAMNARAAAPQGGCLTIRTERVVLDEATALRHIDAQAGTYSALSAIDTGVGMTEAVAARALEPFFTTKDAFGTGLGLSTIHAIAKQAGGHVEIESQVGEGTRVTVYFPAIDHPPAVQADSERPHAIRRGQQETILVAEDEASLRLILCRMLTQHGYKVLQAANAEAALRLMDAHPYAIDLLLTDVIMPGLSGQRLAKLARQRHRVKRVLYMSGYENDVVARQGQLPPGTRLLQKPFLEEDLLRSVGEVLDQATEHAAD